jgi:hypothetical protein
VELDSAGRKNEALIAALKAAIGDKLAGLPGARQAAAQGRHLRAEEGRDGRAGRAG